tara:strand:+ start:20664 stop:21494 length:831 start_codon:yes stop_codon:yes gene_type:complete
MKIAVTGGSGFIGRNFINYTLKKKNIKIINIYNKNNFKHSRVKNIKLDLNKQIDKNIFIKLGRPQYLIHLAWSELDNYDSKNHFITYRNHLNFIKKFKNTDIKKIFILGTCSEYGKRNGELRESFKSRPLNNYAKSKDRLRNSLLKYFKKEKIVILWGRLFYVFGEGQNKRTLFGQINDAITMKKKYFNMSKGNQIRDYLNVKDVAKLLFKVLTSTKKTTIINICSGKPISLKNLIKKWLKKKKSKLNINYGYYRNSKKEADSFWGSVIKLKQLTK